MAGRRKHCGHMPMKRCDRRAAATCSGRVRRLAMFGRLRSGVLGGLAMMRRRRRLGPVAVGLVFLLVAGLFLLLVLAVPAVVLGLSMMV